MKRIVVASALCLLTTVAAWADVSVIERQGLNRVKGPNKIKRLGKAQVRTGEHNLVDASTLEFFINSNITFSTSSSASGAASEASYTSPVQATTSGGGTVSTTLSDAFDGYNTLCVSLTGATGPCSTGDAAFTIYSDNGAGTLDGACGNRQINLNTQTIGPIQVARKVFVPSNDEFIRWFSTFTNTSGSSQTISVVTANNLGSDAATTIVTTSSGDAAVTTADRWVTTFENFTGTTSTDVRLGHVLWGPGAAVGLSGVSFANGDDNPFWSYSLTLAPGETRAILNFATGQPSRAEAAIKSNELLGLPVNALQCLSQAERGQIANFVGIPPAVTEIPTVSSLGLGAIVFLLGGASLFLLRRRTA